MLYLLILFLIPGLFFSLRGKRVHGRLVRVCEAGRRVISCHWPKEINILSANYGRLTGAHVCGGPIRTTNCRAAWSIGKVRGDCQGRSNCTLHASHKKFGDPCFGTLKYLEVKYSCVRRSAQPLVRVCEAGRRIINCPGPKRIKILSANYGRLTGAHVCGGPIRTTNCRASGSLDKVRGDCQGRSKCTLHASHKKFGDPCFGTLKYLEVKYSCVRRSAQPLVRVCEAGRRIINCPGPKRIKILSANYGRLTGAHVCGGPIRTTNCRASGSLGKVRGDCQGRSNCTLHASHKKFGDPCFGTLKYLEVRYKCQ